MTDLFDTLDDYAVIIEDVLDESNVTYIGYKQIETAIQALDDSVDLIETATGVSLNSVSKLSASAANALNDSRSEAIYYLNKGYTALLDKSERMTEYPEIYRVYN